ncbi:MAG TPA: GNAT family N-acetyltransferase [bacterium]|nr:GNAT family N-acetyltransferase [bacterium]HPN32067.1 GNAT family N-acetyltransferase [bacterium]
MKIQTKRLILEPLTIELIDAALSNNSKKIEELGYYVNSEWPENDLIDALPVFKELLMQNGINGFNNWVITLNKMIIGSAGFIGNPDENGETEIGFGIITSMRKKGYCFEAVSELINWAFHQNRVKSIKANCDETNSASISIIRKLGFSEGKRQNGLIEWKKFRKILYHTNILDK